MTELGLFTHARGPSRDTACGQPIRTGTRRLYVVFTTEFGRLRTPPAPWCPACERAIRPVPA